ncbi:hypothetical protein DH2020_047276 [Rehmannia glutinosa]|uniref:Protein kinase domain-containing protein n=1 Tax=Rehmannia glutinosa TaxID=99300 RepID=A0ABR0UA01_REHGL
MLTQSLFLKCFSCLIMLHFLQTCYGKQNPHCEPSFCGNIPNISYPFRLNNDPKQCGNPKYELACENNTTFIYFNSHKYLVQAINYANYTIHITDAAIENNSCSFPNYSLSPYDFRDDYPYSIKSHMGPRYMQARPDITRSVSFVSCPYPVNNSLLLEDNCTSIHRSYESSQRRIYIKLGHLNGSYVMDMCTIDLIVMTSLMPLKNEKNISLSEIHSSLLYGFELSWFNVFCGGKCRTCWFDGERASCVGNDDLCYFGITDSVFPCGGMPVWFVQAFNMITWTLRLGIGMPCMLWLLIYKLRRRHLSTFDIIEGFLRSNNNLMPIRYSYSDIKKMTKGFREKLGEGGYGSVYKGKLRSGHDVAVKVLSKPRANGQDFINEVATIGRIHHVNVVKLVGYCAERSKRALVYDFMPNGSLEKYIFTQQRPNYSLSWQRKYEIAVGVARGIEYLHRGCDIQILHFDIKPHNILLDDNFTPKISDFGLAKFFSTDDTTITLTAARGTIGYVAPELINRSIGGISYKADVYSFGMLLMEMVGLKRDIMVNEPESSQYFPYWIYDRFNKGKDIEIGNADDEDDDGNDENARKITRKMTIVGLWCIQISPVDRPSMSEVVKMLENENGNLQIPPPPSESHQIESYSDQARGTESTGSMALLADDASSYDQ